MAYARWIAVARVQLGRSGLQRRELPFQPAQIGDLGIDLGVAVVDQVGNYAARRLTRVAHAEHLTHLGQCQADRLGGTNERQTVNGVVAIHPIARFGTAWLAHKPELFVVAQRGGGNPAVARQFTDSHDLTIRHLTFERT